ncbi:hypothetical protein, partial [Siccirubricoccus deserti]
VLDRHLHPVSPERSGYRAIMRPRNQPKGRSAEAHRAGGTTVTIQYALAKDHPGGLFDFVRRTPGLDGSALRFKSIAALRRHCQENGIEIAGDLHGCPGEQGVPRTGSGIL